MSNPYSLSGKTIFVTGAAGIGVGAGVCDAVAEAGGRLIINARSKDAAEATAARYPGSLVAVGDISSEADVLRMFAELAAAGVIVDGLVNNAGIGLSSPSHLATSEQFDRLYAVDVRGLWLMTRSFVRQLKAAGRPGSVVNISSVHARATIAQYGLYAGAKGAVEAFTRGLAPELGPLFIRANCVSPGYVHADQNKALIASWAEDAQAWIDNHTRHQQSIPREIEAIDCGRTTVFLLSDAAKSITGQALYVDCGSTCQLYPGDFVPLSGKWKA